MEISRTLHGRVQKFEWTELHEEGHWQEDQEQCCGRPERLEGWVQRTRTSNATSEELRRFHAQGFWIDPGTVTRGMRENRCGDAERGRYQ